jgi:hypothetical protein
MNIICRGRRTGKTIEIIKASARTWNYIVCHDLSECQRIAKIACDMNLDIPFPITFDEFIGGRFCGRNMKGLIIDNADMLLNKMARGTSVKCITLESEDKGE